MYMNLRYDRTWCADHGMDGLIKVKCLENVKEAITSAST